MGTIADVPRPCSPVVLLMKKFAGNWPEFSRCVRIRRALKELGLPQLPSSARRLRQRGPRADTIATRSEEHTSELQSHLNLVCRLLLEKKKTSHGLEQQETILT